MFVPISSAIYKSLCRSSRNLTLRSRRLQFSEDKMDGFNESDFPFYSSLRHFMDFPYGLEKSSNKQSRRNYDGDAKAMAATPADVKEYPDSYVFIIDMPGLKTGDIKVQVEDDNVLLISGERKREEEKEDAKFLRMERRIGKFMRKFVLPEDSNSDAVSAVCHDGVLSVTVEKLPLRKPKKPRTIQVEIA